MSESEPAPLAGAATTDAIIRDLTPFLDPVPVHSFVTPSPFSSFAPSAATCYLCDHADVGQLDWSQIHRHCPDCGLVWLDERFRLDPTRLYDESYYNGQRFEHTGGESGYPDSYADPVRSHRANYYAGYAEQLCGDAADNSLKILDFGCGYGLFLQHAKKYAPQAELVGVEVDPRVANKATRLSGCQVTTALPDMRFDRIMLLDVLEHLNDPRTILERLFDHAKPGARILLTTPNIASWNSRIFKERWNLLNPPEHIMYFNPDTVSTLIGQAGWQLIDLRTQGHPLHNERHVRESWRGRLAKRMFGGAAQEVLLNQTLKVGPVLVALAERKLH